MKYFLLSQFLYEISLMDRTRRYERWNKGSTPLSRAIFIWVGRIVAIAAGCKPAGLAYVGSSPTRPTIFIEI